MKTVSLHVPQSFNRNRKYTGTRSETRGRLPAGTPSGSSKQEKVIPPVRKKDEGFLKAIIAIFGSSPGFTSDKELHKYHPADGHIPLYDRTDAD